MCSLFYILVWRTQEVFIKNTDYPISNSNIDPVNYYEKT